MLSPLAKFDGVVQGYQLDSTAVAASVLDHLKMSNSNTSKCFSAVETLVTRSAAVASRVDAWEHCYARPAEPDTVVPPPPSAPPPIPDPELAALTAPMGAPSGSCSAGCVLSFSVHPSHDCFYYLHACPESGWPRGGEDQQEHPHHQKTTSWRGIAEKQKEPAIPECRVASKGKQNPSEPTAPWTCAEEDFSSLGNINPLTKPVFTSPRKIFVHGISSYGHVYSTSSEGCTECK